ncbi:MAG: cupin domain-containing protein [Filifactoraceae bacterium]
MKKLICLKEIEAFCKTGKKVFYVEGSTIITPSAKDYAKTNLIEFKVGECCETSNSCCDEKIDSSQLNADMIYKALQKIISTGNLNGFVESFMKEQNYLCEKDSCGFKLVRGKTVKLDALDTGNPLDNGKVYYQELISSNDSSPMNAGFLTIENCNFDWDVTIDEIYYIVEGTLTVTIDGKVYTAYPGDSLYAPKGSKVAWGSPDKVKAFYVTY